MAPDAPVFRRVKVLGYESANRRRYTPEAVQAAIKLYEGVKVNFDHPSNPHAMRSFADRFGKLENVTVDAQGLFADLHFNPKHSQAESVRWFAEHQADCLGLSHNAVGQGQDKNGVFEVEKIISVRSVDIVADPATVRTFFEGIQPMAKIKLGKFFESAKWEAKNSSRIQAKLKKLYEDGDMDGEYEMDGDEGPDHHTALKQGFRAACGAVLDDDTMDADAKCKRLSKLLKAHEKLRGDMTQDDEEDDESDMDTEDDEEQKSDNADDTKGDEDDDEVDQREEECKMEAIVAENKRLKKRVDALEAKDKVAAKRALSERIIKECRLPTAAVSEVFLETLLEAPDEKTVRALVEDRKKVAGVKTPVSASSGSGGSTATLDREAAKKQLLKGHR
jgi:hypothetical protein